MKFLTLIMSLVTINSFAGDTYFICADLANDEEFLIDSYFDSTTPTFTKVFDNHDVIGQKISVTFDPQLLLLQARIYNPDGSLEYQFDSSLEWFEYQLVTNRYACKISD